MGLSKHLKAGGNSAGPLTLDELGPSYLRHGLGRATLQFRGEVFRSPLVVADNDGLKRDDGSHLTGDAPGFVAVLSKEELMHQF